MRLLSWIDAQRGARKTFSPTEHPSLAKKTSAKCRISSLVSPRAEALITDIGAREMESGLVRLVAVLLTRMRARVGGSLDQLIDYVVNNAAAWTFPEIANEKPEDRERALADWERHVAMLDTAILSLIGENDIPDEGVEAALDDILQSSLWHRRLRRQDAQVQQVLLAGLLSRSRLIWSQSTAAGRRGYFLAGVGLSTGHALDAIAAEANLLLVQANEAMLEGDAEAAISAIARLAERVFTFYPFTPDALPTNWRDILRRWLLGQPMAAEGTSQTSETLQFVEGGLVYRLPWALEAVRVRGAANEDTVGTLDLALEDHELVGCPRGRDRNAQPLGFDPHPSWLQLKAGDD